MKKFPLKFGFIGASLLLITACGHQTDEQILENAQQCYEIVSLRYEKLLDTADIEASLDLARRIGAQAGDTRSWLEILLGTGQSAEGAPLHKVTRLISQDLSDIGDHLDRLSARLLSNISLYDKLRDIRDSLNEVLDSIQADPNYSEEARFLEMRRIESNRLYEEREQRRLLQAIADRPVVVEEEITYTERKPAKGTKKVVNGRREIAEIEVR